MNTRGAWALLVMAVCVVATAGPVHGQGEEQKLSLTGINYTKWLWGNLRYDGSLYNFTTVPGEGYGDNGQGTEFEILVASKPSQWIEVSGRLKARFNQNFWTNFGGFGGRNPALEDPPAGDCIGGDCGEFDPRSAQYVKFRGLTVRLIPGYEWVDVVTIGSSDWGMFDPFSIGKIRYIDRDNGSGLLFQGGTNDRKLTYDFARISLPRLWAGPNFNTGEFASQDAAYGLQLTYRPSSKFDVAGVIDFVNDIEVDAEDFDADNGRDLRTRAKNRVAGARFGIHPNAKVDIKGAIYSSSADSEPDLGAPGSFGLAGFSPMPAGELDGEAWKVDVDLFDPFSAGLSFNFQYFDIGADYVSIMAARRESDVLLTEGHDGAWGFPGPANAAFGVFAGNPTRIGYGGWQGNAQQVATINVDNEFTDFDEPMAETVIGWKGFTVVPTWSIGALNMSAEYSWIDYNTNWQAYDDPSRSLNNSFYPTFEGDAGVGHNFRTAYAPFQDKQTNIAVLKGDYLLNVGKGVDLSFKVKYIDETDDRMTDARFLPYQAGDCPGGGVACANNVNFYSDGNSSADIYYNPPVITVDGVTGYQWKPFDSVADDDRDLEYWLYRVAGGYQLTDQLHGTLAYELYDVDLKDGNTAFQAYQLHEMASGEHTKNKVILTASYVLGGAEFGLNYEYSFGDFKPDFGGGFVPQVADEATAEGNNVPVGSLGFRGRFGGWNSLEKRDFDHQRLKAFMKVRF